MSAALGADLASRLEGLAEALQPPPSQPGGPIPAAVAVVLLPAAEDPPTVASLRLLLTLRPAGLRNHAGEVSFPGGRHDRRDRTLLETALRECEEELALGRDRLAILGALPWATTIATNYQVRPFVALASDPLPALEPSKQEVAAVLTPALAELAPARTEVELVRRGLRFRTEAFAVGPHLIWGLTYRVTCDLLDRLGLADQS